MIKRTKSAKKYVLIAPLLLVSLTGQLAHADIFKWKDSHGVTQYSDSPPAVSNPIKATRNEVVNALQKKDLCAEPVAKKLINFSSNENANFFNASFKEFASKSIASSTNNNAARASIKNALNTNDRNFFSKVKLASTTNAAIKTSLVYNPFKQNSIFNIGNQKVSVFFASFKIKNGASQSSELKNSPSTNLVTSNSLSTSTVIATNTVPIVVAALPTSGGDTTLFSSQPVPVLTALATSSSSTPVAAPTTSTTSTTSTTGTTTSNSSGIVQIGLMPAVNITKNMISVTGWTDLRIRPAMGSSDIPIAGDGDGQFRIDCEVSHMSNDDPLVYPNQQGAAHHHTFFGNTSIDFKSNLATLSTTGNSTCRGGIANRSAYWVPSMIDTATSTPLKPYFSLWYYKTGYSIPKERITAPPKGLRIVTGNMKANSAITSRNISYNCFKEGAPATAATFHIPSCPQGWTIVTHVGFPQCWDGRNLDSPDHISHMANPIGSSCPVSHPVAIPALGLNVKYLITDPEGTKNWRLSSDNYAKNGYNSGYSSHADWVNGWDENVIAGVVRNCLNAGKDCGTHILGDGTVIYGENRDF